jgi:hypothetical protein
VRILRKRDRPHHALTSRRRWSKRGWCCGTRGGGLPWMTDVGDRRGQPLTGWRAVRDCSRCSRRGRGRAWRISRSRGCTWRSSRCHSGQKSRRDCRSGKGSHKWLESRRDLWGWLARCHGTCSGELGANGGASGARLTKKI